MSLGNRIRSARRKAGLSQEEVARRSKLSLKGYSFIERDLIEDPHLSSLKRIAQSLGRTLEELTGEYIAELRRLQEEGKIRLTLRTSMNEPLGEANPTYISESAAKELLKEMSGEPNKGAHVPIGVLDKPDGTAVTVYLEVEILERGLS